MIKRMQHVSSAAVVLASLVSLPASAEIRGATACSGPTWHALVAGECGLNDARSVLSPGEGGSESPPALLAFEPIPGIPEPETYALMLAGLVAVIAVARRRNRL